MFAKVRDYLQEVYREMQKVSWPSRQELINNTILTLVASTVLALFIFLADRVIATVLEFIYSL
ncbi:preprotein translocase subunit SecE [Rhodothermus marinus]|jgi:preprotein translocase subunit SecE|uniref:Protein translocase subunit SecE n=1 Tax=Rhodothermus marinus (strain ATCC 43812 / DSM 4252 / R-10) TaxID=518766 RepID=D0MHN5_RHOM4|nr:preprotein translocase subunit SecE [Rhodothermus marinus]ACY47993.1 preprotein translocase, SecE subunit [Rhodothermus marinus DSM 4252]AEN72977.1 preprotein translocase, SecE subunit [Rhodothermus marinus SG0.5JP17-172]MBO2492684.1 preprotein translocase subunit SecE [Rhodothermus marinus]BBM69303.1 protein translocase subunit SecE [Rhodothermus marinus]BBM72295.1 protein translocase subunit SecE [Rhodothermus marinus]